MKFLPTLDRYRLAQYARIAGDVMTADAASAEKSNSPYGQSQGDKLRREAKEAYDLADSLESGADYTLSFPM
jgi:hypothetical protein